MGGGACCSSICLFSTTIKHVFRYISKEEEDWSRRVLLKHCYTARYYNSAVSLCTHLSRNQYLDTMSNMEKLRYLRSQIAPYRMMQKSKQLLSG